LHESETGRIDAGRQAGLIKRRGPADDADASEPLRYFQCAGGGIWATTGIPQNREACERELVCERKDIGCPVPYSPAGLELRAAEARPIWNNHADVEAVGQLLTTKQIPFEAAAGRAMEIKDWSSIGAAIFVIASRRPLGNRTSWLIVVMISAKANIGLLFRAAVGLATHRRLGAWGEKLQKTGRFRFLTLRFGSKLILCALPQTSVLQPQ
jgi:hypothetical protein